MASDGERKAQSTGNQWDKREAGTGTGDVIIAYFRAAASVAQATEPGATGAALTKL